MSVQGSAGVVGGPGMPVVAGLQVLAAEGRIQVRTNKRAVVLGINEQTLREHYEIRALVESEAVSKASLPGSDISRIAHVPYAADKALPENNPTESSDPNPALHLDIKNASCNENMKWYL